MLTTLSASLIWGINTLFLLDAGLNNLEAFAANAFFTAGMMVFEVPTGVVADLRGRRVSFLVGALTLMGVDAALRAAVAGPRALLGVGGRVGAAGARVHVLLRRDGGLAGRRAALHRLHRRAGRRVRPGPGGGRCRDAHRLGPRRRHRTGDQPRRPVRRPGGAAGDDLRAGVLPDEGHRLHAGPRQAPWSGGAPDLPGVADLRPRPAAGPLDDAHVTLRGRCLDLRLLRDAALPAGALRRRGGVRHRRPRGRTGRGRQHRRRLPGAPPAARRSGGAPP